MKTTSTTRAAALCALLATTALAAPALAQSPSAPSPSYRNADDNGVDLVSGRMTFDLVEGSIGQGEGAVSLVRQWTGSGVFTDNWSGGLYQQTSGGVTTWYVELGGITDALVGSGGGFVSTKGNGATLVEVTNVANVNWRYTAADGTVIDFRSYSNLGYPLQGYSCPSTATGACSIPVSVTRPNGMKFALQWDIVQKCTYPAGSPQMPFCEGGVTTGYYRFRGVTSSAGYSFATNYVTNTPGNFDAPVGDWYKKTGITFSNSVSACNGACPSVTYTNAGGIQTVTDALNRQWRFDLSTSQLKGIKRPGSATDTTSVSYNGAVVTQVVNEGVTTSYSRVVSGNNATTTITHPAGQKVVVADLAIGRVTSIKDELNRTTSFGYDGSGRLQRVTQPEGNYVQYTYDARGNVTQTQAVAKPGSGLATIAASASYAASCANQKTCNKPVSTTDARGQVTDYAYDATHGGLLSVTAPAAPNGVRPQTRYSYTLTASPLSATQHPGAYLPTGISACQTGSSCAGTADEVKSTTVYGANMLPTTVSNGNGSGTLVATAAMSYDAAGNLLTADGPLAGTDDIVRYRYDLARQRVGTVSPDPDGAGALKHRARRVTYNADGQPTRVESGTVTDQSDAAWTAFAPLDAVETGYDAYARAVTSKLVAEGTVHALTQASYDALGRAECTAQRMNPAAFGSLPVSACSLGAQGSFGPDRIVKAVYNAAGEVTQQRVAVGTADEAAEVSATYRPNGQVETLTDGENNRTTYAYDGHDRLSVTQFPLPQKGALASNPNDYEQLVYHANGDLDHMRQRDGSRIVQALDGLGRQTRTSTRHASGETQEETAYSYDNLGRVLTADKIVGGAGSLSFGYDALGRQVSETSLTGTVASTYDVAGRRMTLSAPGYYVEYSYLTTGEMTQIREGGGFAVASFGYDLSGRRTSLTRGNGTSTGYAYDPVSRLQSLTQELGGTAGDLSLTFGYNPASQIVSNARSNDAFAWSGGVNGTTASSANGLNQLASHGSATPTHDARGNMTSDGTRTFGYLLSNKLASASGGGSNVTLGYDALGRLLRYNPGVETRFGYDGSDLITEHDAAGNVLRLHVHGPGVDEALVTYENGQRRYLHADERGSIVALSDDAGNLVAANRYDEYGRPASTNIGQFGYTGQMWLPEIGLYNYKARMYHSALGRFMQTDPIGYDDGMNMYSYVGNDPVNFTDPSGLCNAGQARVKVPRSGRGRPGEVTALYTYQCVTLNGGSGGGNSPGRGSGGPRWPVSQPQKTKPPQPQPKDKPAYCGSLGYKVGDFIDDELGGLAKNVGAGTIIGGGAVAVASWFTGVGAGAGGAIAGIGGAIYTGGAAASVIGSGVKFLSGQPALNSAGALLSWHAMRAGPVSRAAADMLINSIANAQIKDACD